MNSKAKLLGHPIHQMAIVFPLGLLSTSVAFDIAFLVSGNGRWADIGFWMIACGLLGGMLAALPGALDWWAIPANTRARRIGLLHGLGNAAVLVLFGISWFLRYESPAHPSVGAVLLSFVGFGLAGVTGWLGGELVGRLGVGVHPGANLDAPSSLSGRRANDPGR